MRTFAAKAARTANVEKATSLALSLPAGLEGELRAVAEGLELGAYRFTKYFTGDRKPKRGARAPSSSASPAKLKPNAKAAVALGQRVGAAVNLSRDLSNEPPNVIYPETLRRGRREARQGERPASQVFDFKEIRRRGMKLIDAVGRGSVREPRFVHMSYTPEGRRSESSSSSARASRSTRGGISIKPAAGMGEMKHDMSGAANVVALMAAVAAVKPKVEVHAIAALRREHARRRRLPPRRHLGLARRQDGGDHQHRRRGPPRARRRARLRARPSRPTSSSTTRPSPAPAWWRSAAPCSGWYASRRGRGARVRARRSRTSGEAMWRMPLLEDLREQIKSDVADVKQTGDRWGGSITAALFLREFVGDGPMGPLRHRRARVDRPPQRRGCRQGGDRSRRAHVPRA